jgi:hypothetical protein
MIDEVALGLHCGANILCLEEVTERLTNLIRNTRDVLGSLHFHCSSPNTALLQKQHGKTC